MEKRFKFSTARSGRGPRSYTKPESRLNPNEVKVLLGDLIKHFNSSPTLVQTGFLIHLADLMENAEKNAESNKVQSGEIGMESSGFSESGTTSESTDVREEQVQQE